MTSKKPRRKSQAEKLADYLMNNGIGEKADRLVLVDKHGRDLGGMSWEAVVAAIRRFYPEEK